MRGKTAFMAQQIKNRIAAGEKVIVATPAGTIDGEQWLANRGLDPDALVIESDAPEAEEPAPRKKRKSSTSPTQRTLAECKKRGWTAGVVERHIPFPKPQGTKIDLFGVIDIVAIAPADIDPPRSAEVDRVARILMSEWERVEHKPVNVSYVATFADMARAVIADRNASGALVAIQATASAANHAHRRTKILSEPRAKQWVEAGGRLELWSWSKRGAAGSRKPWTLRVEAFTVEDWSKA